MKYVLCNACIFLFHAPFLERKNIKAIRETYVKPETVRGNVGIAVLFRRGMFGYVKFRNCWIKIDTSHNNETWMVEIMFIYFFISVVTASVV
jgi:hypothetical protein